MGRLTLGERLARAREAVRYVQKSKSAGLAYTYVAHEDVTDAIGKSLFDAGVYTEMEQERLSDTLIKTTMHFICDDDSKERCCSTYITGVHPKMTSNGVIKPLTITDYGTACSYSVKMILLKTFLLPTGDEDAETRYKEYDDVGKTEKDTLTSEQMTEILKAIDGDKKLFEYILSYHKVANLTEVKSVHYKALMDFINARKDNQKSDKQK